MIERIFSKDNIINSYWTVFGATILLSIIAILLGKAIFGSNPGIASVMFLTILLLPLLNIAFKNQEKLEESKKASNVWETIKSNKSLIIMYSCVFLGVFVAYYLISYLGVLFGWNLIGLFKEQLLMDSGLAGKATSEFGFFMSILQNNWWVLLASFVLSLLAEGGGVLFIVWNSSIWAAIFGYRAAASALVLKVSPLFSALIIQLYTTPHILLEGLAYVLASIAGAVISTNIFVDRKNATKFTIILVVSFGLFWFLSFLFRFFMSGWLYPLSLIVMFIGFMFVIKQSLNEQKYKSVFTHNYYVMLIAIAVFILGAIVESIVLMNSDVVNKYYSAAYIYASLK
ncbi:hypothetical protein K9L97_00560 [Candidatus Woesearchaeota archaeon]|nr:hypothetical protein [Candidatus Woesearchaeota archaeon]